MASFSLKTTRVTTLLALVLRLLGAAAEQVLVTELIDDIVSADIMPGGNCHQGCKRSVRSVAHVDGIPVHEQCTLQTRTSFNSTTPEPGLLTAFVYCEDETGVLRKQNTGPCFFDLCVGFEWTDDGDDQGGQLEYEVMIIREYSVHLAPHTIIVELSVAVDPTAAYSNVDSCQTQESCAIDPCTDPNGYRAEIVLVDDVGDGWVGGIDGRYNMWTLYEVGQDVAISRGTLADNHDSSEVTECLGKGEYIFNTTANAAFADDMHWSICDHDGVAGEGLRFTVSDDGCEADDAVKIERATADELDADFSYCSLPVRESDEDYRTTSCTSLSSGLKVDGVAMYYDERCTRADYAGCGARSIEGCRLCFVDKELWQRRFPNSRVPEYEMCPCCVAEVLGVECATASSGGGGDKDIIIWVTIAIVGIIAIACCMSCAFGSTILRFFRRCTKKRRPDLEMELDINGASAFPDSPTAGNGTLNGNTHGHRGRVVSGHFPIPRFDSIRGRFDSGIFASNNTAAYAAPGAASSSTAVAGTAHEDEKQSHKDTSVAAVVMATPSPQPPQARGSPNAPRSTVLDGRLVSKGYTASDVGRPVSGGRASRNPAGWDLAMSGELYPDLDQADPYAGDNAMVDGGSGDSSRHGLRHSSALE